MVLDLDIEPMHRKGNISIFSDVGKFSPQFPLRLDLETQKSEFMAHTNKKYRILSKL